MLTRALALALASLLLAGCSASNSPDGQSASGGGHLAYNGASAGSHEGKHSCDGSGTVTVTTNLGGGKVTVRVLDAAGATAYTTTVTKTGQTYDSKPVQGAEGKWTLSATREATTSYGMAMWSGQYDVSLAC